jgi:hypothetical protein
MSIALPTPAPAEFQRLEAAAAARPGLYRLHLVLLAVVGDVLLTLIRVFPVAVPIVIGALFFDSTVLHLLAAAAVLLLIWVMRPGRRASGTPLLRRDAPELHAELDELKRALDVRGPIDVQLDDELNAGAREERGLFGLIGTRRVLTLGLPLLALLGKGEACAVIAHEFGHFSRRHGRLGHWLYWAHLDWLAYAEATGEESSLLDRAGAVLAEIFAPVFCRRAMVWSRRCEYEADADAARIVGGARVVGALARLAVFERWHADELPRLVREWEREEPAPPDDFLGRMITAFESAPPDCLATVASGALSRSPGGLDTHPAVVERATALGVESRLVPREEQAGSALLGGYWPAAAAGYNALWREGCAVRWAAAHARYRLIDAPLIAAEPAAVSAWPMPQRLERARAMRRLDPVGGLEELAALHAAAPDDAGITFAYAAARLAEGDTDAVEMLTRLAKDRPAWREPVCARLVRYYERTDDRARASRWAEQLKTELARTARAVEAVGDRIRAGELSATSRPQPFVDTLRAGLAGEPAIAKAWLLEGEGQLAGKTTTVTLPVDAMVLVVDPLDARQKRHDADAIKARQHQILGDLIGAGALPVVVSFYSTEPLPPALQAMLGQHPSSKIYVR